MKKIILLLFSISGIFLFYGCSSEYEDQMEYEYQEKIQNLESKIDSLKREIDYKEETINSLESKIEELEQELEELY